MTEPEPKKAAWDLPVMRRADISIVYPGARAQSRLPATNHPMRTSRAVFRGSRRVRAGTKSAPTTTPLALPETSNPALLLFVCCFHIADTIVKLTPRSGVLD